MRKCANHADRRSGRKAYVRKTLGTKPMRSRAARNRPCSSGGRSASSGTGNQEMRSSSSSISAHLGGLLPAGLLRKRDLDRLLVEGDLDPLAQLAAHAHSWDGVVLTTSRSMTPLAPSCSAPHSSGSSGTPSSSAHTASATRLITLRGTVDRT